MRVRIMTIAGLLVAGCQEGSLTFERMVTQHRVDRYQQTSFFANERALQVPPLGTQPRALGLLPELVRDGEQDGQLATEIPVPHTEATLLEGRRRFLVHCAPCHGAGADGQSYVARFMTLMRPRSLVTPPVSDYPPGRLFQTVSRGFKYMRSYQDITVEHRWAIVQYVKSLPAQPAQPAPAPTEGMK